jgi:large subunit ribosomal protein L5
MADEKNKEQKEHKEKKPKADGDKALHPKAAAAAKARKAKAEAAAEVEETGADQGPIPTPRLALKYREAIVPSLKQKLGIQNALALPRLEKIVISMGLGKAICIEGNKARMDVAEKELATIAGQKPVRCKAKKAVSNFKVREGQETGLKVTLRGIKMYEFLDRLVSLAIPRVKDFRGLDPNGFDKSGNYNFGLTEQTVFPEIDAAAVTFQQGMNITIVMANAKNAERGRELLKEFGFPFRSESDNSK